MRTILLLLIFCGGCGTASTSFIIEKKFSLQHGVYEDPVEAKLEFKVERRF